MNRGPRPSCWTGSTRHILDSAAPGELVLSTQVLQEFYVTATRKLPNPLPLAQAADAVQDFAGFPVVPSDARLVLAAVEISRSAQLSLWDALLIEAARTAGCDRILTEDLNHGATIGGVRIENPFGGS
ncbi:MAG: PIN domain nuclease [Acidimicrobiales bacterium]|nr:MAG: PIN domain nuclease [Acidimicrobiales bacterium]